MESRIDPPFAAVERTMLLAFLDYQRESVVMKLQGLSEEQARWTPAPTANSLVAITNHLAWVERGWFGLRFAGEDPPEWWIDDPDDPDVDFTVPPDRAVDDVVAFYRAEWERANKIAVAAVSLDDPSRSPGRRGHRRPCAGS